MGRLVRCWLLVGRLTVADECLKPSDDVCLRWMLTGRAAARQALLRVFNSIGRPID